VPATQDAINRSRDIQILFTTRILRLFAYGFLSVVLVLYLVAAGLSEKQIGLLLTLTLVGDTAISLWITTSADRFGRKRMLIVGTILMIFAGILFGVARTFALLLVAATIGVISPSGNEVGPFLAIEQAALSEQTEAKHRTRVFAWYNLVGSFATALGAFVGGGLSQLLQGSGMSTLASYQAIVFGYAIIGAAMAVLFSRVSAAVEPPVRRPVSGNSGRPGTTLGLRESRGPVLRLSGLFAIDAFAGGFIVQAFVAYWFHVKFGVNPAMLGAIFFCANVLAGISALSAARLANRIGLLRTMVVTHIPSNLLLIFVPLMPSLPLAIAVLLLRFSISQMDVPTRQAYTMALVAPNERSAAGGVTAIARTVGASLSPLAAGPLYGLASLASIPFFISGGLKIIYDIVIWLSFRKVKLPEKSA
jgi:MFS family permease